MPCQVSPLDDSYEQLVESQSVLWVLRSTTTRSYNYAGFRMRDIRGSKVNVRASTNGGVSVIRGRLRPVTAHVSPRKRFTGQQSFLSQRNVKFHPEAHEKGPGPGRRNISRGLATSITSVAKESSGCEARTGTGAHCRLAELKLESARLRPGPGVTC
jgi:hypothetical protein